MDNVSWSQERFDEIRTKLDTFLRQVGFKGSDLHYVPCSGLAGENINDKPKHASSTWYTGPTLIDVIGKPDFLSLLRIVTLLLLCFLMDYR